jgi:lipopolysaccharide export system protein LptA
VRKLSVALFAAVVVALQAHGAPKETVITSKKMNFDYKRNVVEFNGSVVVVDPQMRMESDTLTVLLAGTNEVKSVTADGAVRIKLPDKAGTCDKAVYTAKESKIVMTGNAKVVVREKDSVSGDEITIWFNEDRMVCKPARLVITPDDKGGAGTGIMDFGSGGKQSKPR